MTDKETTAIDERPSLAEGLTREEDDELRRLHYFQQVGTLAGQKLERFLELRLRDRRKAIRAPREFVNTAQHDADTKLAWRLLFRRNH